jgi:hypothetical protein
LKILILKFFKISYNFIKKDKNIIIIIGIFFFIIINFDFFNIFKIGDNYYVFIIFFKYKLFIYLLVLFKAKSIIVFSNKPIAGTIIKNQAK